MGVSRIPDAKKRQAAVGAAIAILGLIGVVEAIIMTPIYEDDMKDSRNKFWLSEQLKDRIKIEKAVIDYGFFVGLPVLIFGVIAIILAVGDQPRLDAAAFHRIRVRDPEERIPPRN